MTRRSTIPVSSLTSLTIVWTGSSPFSMLPFGRSQWPAGYLSKRYLGEPDARRKTTAPADLSSRRFPEVVRRGAGLALATLWSLCLWDRRLPMDVEGHCYRQEDREPYRELVAEKKVDADGHRRGGDDSLDGRSEVLERERAVPQVDGAV